MIALCAHPIDPRAVERAVAWTGAGAILTFIGVARDHFDGRPVLGLEYEAYAEMAIPEMVRILAEIRQQIPAARLAIVHRTGAVALGEPSVVIAAASPHRAEAYEASRRCIEALKARVPVWKKELYRDGAGWRANRA